MSQILDALKKAERQRERNSDNETVKDAYKYVARANSPAKKRRFKPIFLLLPICGFAVYLAYSSGYLSKYMMTPAGLEENTSLKVKASSVEKTIAEEVVERKSVAKKIVNDGLVTLAAIPPPPLEKKDSAEAELLTLKSVEKKAPKKANKGSPAKKVKKPKLDKGVVVKKPKSVNKKVAKNKAAATKAKVKVPAWRKNMVISAIVYSESRKDRFALINGKKLKVGGKIPSTSYKIVQILEKGLVINDGNGDVLVSTY